MGNTRSADPDTVACGDAAVRADLVAAPHRMVEHQLVARGIRDPRVLDAMRTTGKLRPGGRSRD